MNFNELEKKNQNSNAVNMPTKQNTVMGKSECQKEN